MWYLMSPKPSRDLVTFVVSRGLAVLELLYSEVVRSTTRRDALDLVGRSKLAL